jgi:spore germination cell wall hydrolase CwlJ-like protein
MEPLMCLAVAVFFEARGEPIDGQIAVAEVVMNRVADERYPDTVCGVVFEPKAFSFTHDGLPDRLPSKDPLGAAETALTVASEVMGGDTLGITSTHYHTTSVSPHWNKHFDLDGVVGNHVFYTNNTPYK